MQVKLWAPTDRCSQCDKVSLTHDYTQAVPCHPLLGYKLRAISSHEATDPTTGTSFEFHIQNCASLSVSLIPGLLTQKPMVAQWMD
jgi:hypothetical protein